MDKNKKQIFRYGGSLSWEEREFMIKEYLTGKYTKVELWKKYTGQDEEHGQLLRWMRDLGYVSNETPRKLRRNSLHSSIQSYTPLDKDINDKDPAELQKRIKELEKQLETAQLKAEGYKLMIEVAEKELKIPIRKKSATK